MYPNRFINHSGIYYIHWISVLRWIYVCIKSDPLVCWICRLYSRRKRAGTVCKFVCPFWIYDLECKKKGIFFCLYFTDKYRMLKNLAKQTGVKIRIYKKHGLPFVMHKFPNIKGMLAGLAVFIVLLSFVYPCVEHTGRRKSRIEFRFNSAHRWRNRFKRRYGKK